MRYMGGIRSVRLVAGQQPLKLRTQVRLLYASLLRPRFRRGTANRRPFRVQRLGPEVLLERPRDRLSP